MSAFIVSQPALERNARILREVADAAGCRVVLALKGFSTWPCFEDLRPLLDGCCASGLWEALLARRRFGKHVLTYSPAYAPEEIAELAEISDHLDFNSLTQWNRFRKEVTAHPRFLSGELKCGLRINPKFSTGHTPLYDPCAPGSRLGVTPELMRGADLSGISGLHFHTLCEQDADALAVTLDAVAEKFGDLLPKMKWLNFGGGHHITRPGYDMATLEKCIRRARNDWGVTVYLEPGEACALNAGYLLTRVLDVVQNGDTTVAILDASAACHTPDVIEMPYRPPLLGAGEPGEKPCTVRLAGPTCLAGDVIGDYSFDAVPAVGDLLVFGDMAIYTTCKNNTFNGMPLPGIYARKPDGTTRKIVTFGYTDFKCRLGK